MSDHVSETELRGNDAADSPERSATRSENVSQEELHRRYLEQQRRLLCPGCGEGNEYY